MNTASQSLLSLQRPAYKAGPCLASATWLLNSSLHWYKSSLSDKTGSLCFNCVTWFMVNICFPSMHLVEVDQPGQWLFNGLTWALFATGSKVCCVTLYGREWRQKACIWVPPDAACAFFPCDPAVTPYYITEINLSLEYNYMLSPVCLSSQSPDVWVVSGHKSVLHF